jgi:hypothetical protein
MIIKFKHTKHKDSKRNKITQLLLTLPKFCNISPLGVSIAFENNRDYKNKTPLTNFNILSKYRTQVQGSYKLEDIHLGRLQKIFSRTEIYTPFDALLKLKRHLNLSFFRKTIP